MAPLSLRSLILTVSVAIFATFTAAAPVATPTPEDPCTVLGSKTQGITRDEVAACYQYIPYNATVATSTLKTLHTLFNDYFVFRDSALTPNLALPFTSAPVDIVEELNKIGQTQYENDFQFHSTVFNTISRLNDAHAAYAVNCYFAYKFAQHLTLYAPVIEGKQSIRVFVDIKKRGYDDCEVLTIDGQAAFPYIRAFAETLGFSKDNGVRLNQALASDIYDRKTGVFVPSSGGFSERLTLPDKGSITYELQCQHLPGPVTFQDEWTVSKSAPPSFEYKFNDYKSYLSNICHRQSSEDTQKHALFSFDEEPSMPKKSALLDLLDVEPTRPEGISFDFPDATYIGSGNATIFYQLKSRHEIGVIVVHTHKAKADELQPALDALEEFYRRGVTKLIIDLQGNGGGSVAFASLLVQAFFPNKDPLEKSLPSDLRVNESIQKLSLSLFDTDRNELYDANEYIDLETKADYVDNSLFHDVVTLTRNGRQAEYCEATTISPDVLPEIPELATYAWTTKSDHFAILTDGRCGSS
ncbi:hypothetical protein BGZ65_008503, partial [Modicella reniformis]